MFIEEVVGMVFERLIEIRADAAVPPDSEDTVKIEAARSAFAVVDDADGVNEESACI